LALAAVLLNEAAAIAAMFRCASRISGRYECHMCDVSLPCAAFKSS